MIARGRGRKRAPLRERTREGVRGRDRLLYPLDEDAIELPDQDGEEDLADESPVEDREDWEPEARTDYLEALWSGDGRSSRKARLALVLVDNTLRPMLQNYRPQRKRYVPGAVSFSIQVLRASGEVVASSIGEWPMGEVPRLHQSETARIVAARLEVDETTVRSRLSVFVRDGSIELPDGRVMPFGTFFYRRGDPTANVPPRQNNLLNQALRELMARYPELPTRRLAERFLTEDPECQHLRGAERKKKSEAIRKRLERLRREGRERGTS